MSSQLKKDDITLQVRDKLRINSVKLWLQPYYSELTGPSFADLRELAQEYSESIRVSLEECYEAILELQDNALENLKQNDRFKKCGMATIKIKILHPNSPARILTKELLLSLRPIDVKDLITKEINLKSNRIKLIFAGKVLNDADNLGSQGVKNGQQILAITLSESVSDIQKQENQMFELEGIKTDSRLLADDGAFLEDQFGNTIKIPQHEKQALIVAMALHEKGRAALKREDYSQAIIFLLEADKEFKCCNSQLLNSVDNYALLDLDIAWCYLCLQSVINLPEAYERLKRCEDSFHRSYGNNLERLIAVKGATGNEAALFMRLHLLQAIVLYHKNKRSEALHLMKKAQRELEELKVDEDSVLVLVELGFSLAEARLGLRATGGDVNNAANYIKENRDKRKQSRKRAMAENILDKKKKKLGLCSDGKQYVDPNFVKILVNMGYSNEAARLALKETNNVISDSIQHIQENPQPGPSNSKSFEFMALLDDLLPELEAAGFDRNMARMALHNHRGDITKAAEDLLAHNGIVDGDWSIFNVKSESVERIKAKELERVEALKRLSEDISMVDDDHLDLTLVQEEAFLNQYLSLLENQ